MTATPIPRTLALTVYGDLAVSEIAPPPADRKPVITAWVTEDRSSEAYSRLCRHLDDGQPGVRRLSADRGVRDDASRVPRRRRRSGSGVRSFAATASAACTGACARPSAGASWRVQGAGARRPRRDDGDRGRRRRPERDDHDRPGGRPLRPRPAPSAARARRARRRAVVLPPRLARARRSSPRRRASGSRRWSRRPTASSSPSATSRSGARASSSARASRALRPPVHPAAPRPGAARARAALRELADEGLLRRRRAACWRSTTWGVDARRSSGDAGRTSDGVPCHR